MSESTPDLSTPRLRHPRLKLAIAAVVWFALYELLEPFSHLLVNALPIAHEGHLAGALQFFLYDTPKVLLLLTGVVFLMGIIHTYISAERTRSLLAGRGLGIGNAMAASLGIVTPFCSCSAVPLFIGFLQAGVPLGVTFSFLIAAPMVNEIALGMLFALFGFRIAALYLAMGLLVAILAGTLIGRLRLEGYLEDWVRELQQKPAVAPGIAQTTSHLDWSDRVGSGLDHVRDVVGKVWPYIVAGVALGAGIHGYVPEDFMASLMGRDAWWAVPAAVVLGVPMYTNAAGVIPIVEALLAKGAALGTVLAFMMSVIALSAPEMLILRKVLKPRLIATFAGIVASGILVVGYVFNIVL
ncbi:MAG: permease [Deltaproteobacteria bacterium]|nr:MAG: permease [Deltaproteobacteria bacterium]